MDANGIFNGSLKKERKMEKLILFFMFDTHYRILADIFGGNFNFIKKKIQKALGN